MSLLQGCHYKDWGQGFPLVSMSMNLGYFHALETKGKKELKKKKDSLDIQFPIY